MLNGRKTFFNINYQLLRSRNASVATGLVPTEAERNGDFSQALNPLTGKPVVTSFPNNIIPSSQIDPAAQGVRRMNAVLAAEPRLSATAIQTVGSKGWDGFALVLVIADP